MSRRTPTAPLREVPPDLYGRWRHDPLIGAATVLLRGWWPFWRPFAPLRPVSRDDGVTVVEVVDRQVVAGDENVVALTLAAAGGAELPPWHPGAHLDLLLPSGRMREYSLCADPADRYHYRIAVRHIPDGGGGSVEVHDRLEPGMRIPIKGPRNAFPLVLPAAGSGGRLRFVAGGIGITPILPMLAAAEAAGADWSMIYVGRSRQSLPFLDELSRYGDRVVVRTDDEAGIPDTATLLGPTGREAGTAVYACGPAPMLESLRTALTERPGVALHYERFSPPPVLDGKPFEVTLARSGRRVKVAADESVLAAVRRVQPEVAYSCRQGFCGTCRVRVVAGEVEHRDRLLTDDERRDGDMLICVSRCRGTELTLDL